MKLVIGLGNPGTKYQATRHNIGFITVDEWAYQQNEIFNKAMFDAIFFEQRIGDEKVIFMKPQTYMNLSGEAVRPIMSYFKIAPEDVVVIYDDMDLPIGSVRLRQTGGSGGHNGIKSLIECLGTKSFNRLRIGIGRPNECSVVSHVLSPFEAQEQEAVLSSVQTAIEVITDWLQQGDYQKTMNTFNKK